MKRKPKRDKREPIPTDNGIFERDGQWYIACGDKLYKINMIKVENHDN